MVDQRIRSLLGEIIAVEAILIRVLAKLAADDNCRHAISAGFDEAADLLEQRAAGCRGSFEADFDVEALRIVEELRDATLGKPKRTVL